MLLFAGNIWRGVLSGSIAITADAFNNLSDAGSSFITLVGFRFSGMKADASHPFGHGRIEYISGFGVSVVIILMGVSFKDLGGKDPASGTGKRGTSAGGNPGGVDLRQAVHVVL